MAASLTTLKSRVATELHRSELTSQIADAISTAIRYYRSRRFEFTEKQSSFNTVASQESYASGDTGFPTDIGAIDSVRVTQSGIRVLIDELPFFELQRLSTTTTATGRPSYWAWYAQKLFFYPIPDTAYSTLVSYQQRKAEPSSDSDDTTVWTNDAEPLIRACAKKLIARDYMYDEALAARCEAEEAEALTVLMRESIQLQDEGGLSPNW